MTAQIAPLPVCLFIDDPGRRFVNNDTPAISQFRNRDTQSGDSP
ncbi:MULTISPECIES: hypothetical protein [Xanthomonas]|nr:MULTISPECIES: hypothetical protein [Xanthomonas]UZB15340.1 hypothetical protein OM949_14915 [Xanthomonas phaseoli pv. phaseoli]